MPITNTIPLSISICFYPSYKITSWKIKKGKQSPATTCSFFLFYGFEQLCNPTCPYQTDYLSMLFYKHILSEIRDIISKLSYAHNQTARENNCLLKFLETMMDFVVKYMTASLYLIFLQKWWHLNAALVIFLLWSQLQNSENRHSWN